jgi:hypothetical protein
MPTVGLYQGINRTCMSPTAAVCSRYKVSKFTVMSFQILAKTPTIFRLGSWIAKPLTISANLQRSNKQHPSQHHRHCIMYSIKSSLLLVVLGTALLLSPGTFAHEIKVRGAGLTDHQNAEGNGRRLKMAPGMGMMGSAPIGPLP